MLHSRIDRVQKVLQTEIGLILDGDLRDPRLPSFITVSAVKVSRDLREAVVFITFLGDVSEEVIKQAVAELNHSAGYVRTLVARRVPLKRHPRLRFVYNPSTHYALDLEKLFEQIRRERGPEQEE